MKNYKEIWNNLSHSFNEASFHVCCLDDEDEIRQNGKLTTAFMREVLSITTEDKVLEIGCGVGRIGKELAPYCNEWHGSDISGNMIRYAAGRLVDIPNAYLHELTDSSLSGFPDNCFDCVYSSIVFMHLDKIDMFNYMKEAHRVLVPGGRAYFDTLNIFSPDAWEIFLNVMKSFAAPDRPQHAAQFSNPQEMEKFMQEAGFEQIHVDGNNPQLVVALGNKAEQSEYQREKIPPGVQKEILNSNRNTSSSDDQTSATTPVGDATQSLHTAELEQANSIKNAYMAELEGVIAVKNAHILRLERMIQGYEKALNTPPGRLAQLMERLISRRLG